jgi:hypothetical protein
MKKMAGGFSSSQKYLCQHGEGNYFFFAVFFAGFFAAVFFAAGFFAAAFFTVFFVAAFLTAMCSSPPFSLHPCIQAMRL